MKKLVTLSFIFLFTFGKTQVPGYFGKKFSIQAGVGLTPCLYQTQEIGLALAATVQGGMGIVLSRKSSFHFNVEMSKSAVGLRSAYMNGLMINEDQFDYEIREASATSFYESGLVNAKVLQIGGYFKFFQGNFVSPAGRYLILGGGITRYGLTDKNVNVEYYGQNQELKTAVLTPRDPYRQKFTIMLGLGKGVALNNKLLMDLQMVANVSPIRYETPYLYYNVDEYIYDNLWRVIKFREALQLNLNIKYLLF